MTGPSCDNLRVIEINLENKKVQICFRKCRRTPEDFVNVYFCLTSFLLNSFALALSLT